MPQTFNQNGHTFGSMWTFWSSWHSKKPHFFIMATLNQKNVFKKKNVLFWGNFFP